MHNDAHADTSALCLLIRLVFELHKDTSYIMTVTTRIYVSVCYFIFLAYEKMICTRCLLWH